MPVAKRASDAPPVPYWTSPCGRAVVYVGDCREMMAQMEPEQFHAVVTDPPYGLGKEPDVAEVMTAWIRCGHHQVGGSGFMGKTWDAFVPQPATWRECYKTMKPGAHLLCFAGTRTLDWMGMSLRFVGLECRDLIMWVYGSGYPKGTNVGKAIDKALGAERGKTRTPMSQNSNVWMDAIGATRPWKEEAKRVGYHEHDNDDPVTDAAKQWDGWNTALKPSYEPVILARRPLPNTIAQCVMDHGTGAINVDGCRVGTTGGDITRQIQSKSSSGSGVYQFNSCEAGEQSMRGGFTRTHKDGRWPANLCHDGSDEVVELFPQSDNGGGPSSRHVVGSKGYSGGLDQEDAGVAVTYGDSGSAARFFYTSKADDDDRPHGKGAVVHPTVKPLDLMKWLVRLVCAPGGTVLDPFMGSGSTGCAAVEEGMWFVGVEQSQEYADIAVGRLKLSLAKAPATARMEAGQVVQHAPETPPTPERL